MNHQTWECSWEPLTHLPYPGFKLPLGDFGEGGRKRALALHSMISEHRGNFKVGYCNRFPPGRGKARTWPNLYWIQKQPSAIVAGSGGGFVLCGLDDAHILSGFRCDYGGPCFCLDSLWSQAGLA